MKKLFIILAMLSSLAVAESGVKIHALNIGHGYGDAVHAEGYGVAYKSIFFDYYHAPDQTKQWSVSKSSKFDLGILQFGSYAGVTSSDNPTVQMYSPKGAKVGLFFQPYIRIGHEVYVEFSAINGGAKFSFAILN